MTMTTLIGTVIIAAILHLGQDVFLPLAVAMLLTFALSPLVNMLRKRGLPHLVAVLGAVTVTFTAIGLFLLVVVSQLSSLAQQLPTFQANIMTKVETISSSGSENGLAARLGGMLEAINAEIGAALPAAGDSEGQAPQEGEKAPSDQQGSDQPRAATNEPMPVRVVEPSNAITTLINLVSPLVGPVATAGLVIVVVIFMLLERDELRDRFIRLVGSNDIHRTTLVLEEAGGRVGTYLLMQLLVNVIYALPIGLGLWFIGVPNALLWGLLTLVLRFVPYIGSILAAAFPLFLAFAVAPDWSAVLWTAALFLVVEFVTSNVIEPWLYGSRTGVSALAIIVSAIFWTWIWGPMGLVLSTPLTVCLVVLGRHIPQFEVFDVLFGDEPVLSPHARLYQRLLVGDAVESTARAEEALEEDWVSDYHRDVALPAMMLAQIDHERGLISQAQELRLAATGRTFLDDLELAVQEERDAPPEEEEVLEGLNHRVMFMGGRSHLDDLAARMLAQSARAEGAEVRALSHEDLTPSRFAQLIEAVKEAQPESIILTFLDLAPARGAILQVRRLKKVLPEVRVGVTILQPPAALLEGETGFLASRRVEEDKVKEVLETGADFCVTSADASLEEAFSGRPVVKLVEKTRKTARRPSRIKKPEIAAAQ